MTKEKLEQIVKDLAENGDYREGESCSYYMSEIDAFQSGFWKAVNLLWDQLEEIRTENKKLKEKLREKNDQLEDKVYHATRLVEELRLENEELKQKLEMANEKLIDFAVDQLICIGRMSGN